MSNIGCLVRHVKCYLLTSFLLSDQVQLLLPTKTQLAGARQFALTIYQILIAFPNIPSQMLMTLCSYHW